VIAIGALAFLSFGGTNRSGTLSEQVQSWVDGSGLGQSIGTLVADMARVRVAVAEHKGSGVLHTDCGVLVTDAQSTNAELPSPDTELTDLLSSGYTLAYAAGNDCYDSGGTNTRLLARATRERIEAEAKLQEAVNLINRLTNRVLSTTTTTQPGGGGLFG